mmetsp:Transcript_18589/g.25874  ORF Transcript_18589/g.25874 Transcript_18589/m.25874 type:complete len:90 (-) Transcript_18589:454-723(-)
MGLVFALCGRGGLVTVVSSLCRCEGLLLGGFEWGLEAFLWSLDFAEFANREDPGSCGARELNLDDFSGIFSGRRLEGWKCGCSDGGGAV